ncbi:NifU family protein [Buchnera aphidicola]|uniref:NifU family protein n=1 Tax=Buchnera aphidicola TaxID=9 RepID=UPI0031B88345
MINISHEAQIYIKKLILKKKKSNILRMSISFPGTKYAECKISYDIKENLTTEDTVMKYDGFNIYVKTMILPYFKDAKIEILHDNLDQQLMLMAPYAQSQLSGIHKNEDIFLKKNDLLYRVQDFIDFHVNPMLNMHGGKIILLDIKEGYIMIEFLGGCNGCTMSKDTLKNGIEKRILSEFPSIKGVKDLTKHARGIHSFI